MPSRTGHHWRKVVARVIRRDHGICHLCGQPGADTADHVIPVSKGGALYDLHNLRAAHHNAWPNCNRVRGDRDIATAKAMIAARIARDAATKPEADVTSWAW